MTPQESVEQSTREIGSEILDRIERARPADFKERLARDPLAGWSAQGPNFLADVFRFIDLYPTLQDDAALMDSLEACLWEPAWLLPEGDASEISADGVRALIQSLQRRFIAGETSEEALAQCRALREAGMDFTLDVLGEAVLSSREEEEYAKAYLDLIPRAARAAEKWPGGGGVNLSVKLTSLYCRLDPIDPAGSYEGVGPRLREIFRSARDHGASINVDMEQYACKDLTLGIFKRILAEAPFRDWAGASVTIQTYLPEWRQDLEGVAAWARERGAPVSVRLVKGAYWDQEAQNARYRNWPIPVFTKKEKTDAAFEEGTRLLLEQREWLRPAVAGHNVRSMAHALALARSMGLKPGELEFQTLYGLGEELRDTLKAMGERVRVYMPFGRLRPGMAYLARRLLEATSRSAYLRAMWRSPLPREELLRAPNPGPDSTARANHGFRNQPAADFRDAEARRRMEEAIGRVRAQLGKEYALCIAGEKADGESLLARENPGAREEIVGRVHLASRGQADEAVRAAAKAFPGWAATPAADRAALLRRAAALMRERRFELAAWEMMESAKGWREADSDVAEAIDYLEFYAGEMLQLSKPRRRDVLGERNEYFHEPRGVAAAITPWNFPLAILTGVVSAAVVTGNTVIMKPAAPSSIVAAHLMEIWKAAGAPAGVIQYLPCRGSEVGEHLAAHRDVALIAFTGSLAVGARINQSAARIAEGQRHIKRVIAEMGGKNAIIVDRSADLDQAVPGVMTSAFGYQGQKCSACARAVVVREVYEEFIGRLIEAVASLPIGPAWDPHAALGPVITAEAAERIRGYIQLAGETATIAFEGDVSAWAEKGHYVPPVIVRDVDSASRIAQEEIFGPVLSVIRAEDFDEAVRIANDVAYGLTGGLYSRNPRRIAAARTGIQAGNVYVNRPITGALADRQPFGGFKLSGIGSKAGGPDYLLQFMQPKTFTEYTVRRGFAPPEG